MKFRGPAAVVLAAAAQPLSAHDYASRLPREPDEGIEDIHFHPLEPRSLRASIGFHW